MKLQAVMENLHRQQRAKLLMEQQLQQQAAAQHAQIHASGGVGGIVGGGGVGGGRERGGDELMGSPAPEVDQTQMAALAAMRAVAAGLQKVSDSPMSERSSGGEGEDEDEDDDDRGEQHYKDMMGSDEEEQIKRKWDEEDFEGEMEEDFDDELAEEGLPTGHDAVAPGKGILLLPHRQLHPHSQLLKVRPSVDQEPHVAVLPTHATHSHLGGQDHGEWTYEEQFRQLYELDRDPKRKEFLDDLFSFMQKRGTPVNRIPIMAKQVLDLYMLYRLVTEKGGLVEVINKKLWREITKGLNLPTSITSAAFTLRTQYMKYLYPYECDKRGLSNPNELQAAIDSNRREGRRQSFGSSLFTYSPNGTPTMLSSPKLPAPTVLPMGTNGASLTPTHKIKKEEGVHPHPGVSIARLPVGALAGHSVAAVQAAAAQAAMAAQVAALEQLRDKLEAGEPPEKKMALPAEEHHRLLQRALQHNLLAMTAQLPMNIRINNQESRQDSAVNLTTSTNGTSSISMSVELNGVVYTGVLFAQAAAGAALSGASGSFVSNKTVSGRVASQQQHLQQQNTPTSNSTSSSSLS
ncbi:AT-rich interactive domain-containing protein 3A [Nelusetta ayraudi]|uniref:AT-rich interactive domain-containing protein 3A n=1 Tax=Nelusetta ayraudi TaxID=303726 RepID=UPI003F72909E